MHGVRFGYLLRFPVQFSQFATALRDIFHRRDLCHTVFEIRIFDGCQGFPFEPGQSGRNPSLADLRRDAQSPHRTGKQRRDTAQRPPVILGHHLPPALTVFFEKVHHGIAVSLTEYFSCEVGDLGILLEPLQCGIVLGSRKVFQPHQCSQT